MTDKYIPNTRPGICFAGVLWVAFATLLVLNLTGVWPCGWMWVLAPLWVIGALWLSMVTVFFFVMFCLWLLSLLGWEYRPEDPEDVFYVATSAGRPIVEQEGPPPKEGS